MTVANLGRTGTKPILALLGLGLAAMLLASALYRVSHPSLTVANEKAHGPAEAGGQGMGAMAGMGEMGALMTRAAKDPKDLEALQGIAERFLMMESYDRAEPFVDKALVVAPGSAELLHLKAVVLFGKQAYPEAETYLRQSLAVDPGRYQAHFDLGMLLKHFLKKPADAAKHFQAVLDAPGVDPEIQAQAAQEIAGK